MATRWKDSSVVLNIYRFINQVQTGSWTGALREHCLVLELCAPGGQIIVVHGDRVEALAEAMVGALNNILVAHVRGEVSGTVDELIRHSVTKMSHFILFPTRRQSDVWCSWARKRQSTSWFAGHRHYEIASSSTVE